MAIYDNLDNKYQADFFGEASVIDAALLPCGENDNTSKNAKKNHILLPHQLYISEVKTPLEVTVVMSFYQGNHYLIQTIQGENNIYFYHPLALKKGTTQYLTATL
ncbi:hypothetical protein SCB49_05752 [unidentified eubacterium SCB49]|nr:hypothetical protein SCB49_05752 [unidentified eubacterium SCB49]